jgi:hypothetical protein
MSVKMATLRAKQLPGRVTPTCPDLPICKRSFKYQTAREIEFTVNRTGCDEEQGHRFSKCHVILRCTRESNFIIISKQNPKYFLPILVKLAEGRHKITHIE